MDILSSRVIVHPSDLAASRAFYEDVRRVRNQRIKDVLGVRLASDVIVDLANGKTSRRRTSDRHG